MVDRIHRALLLFLLFPLMRSCASIATAGTLNPGQSFAVETVESGRFLVHATSPLKAYIGDVTTTLDWILADLEGFFGAAPASHRLPVLLLTPAEYSRLFPGTSVAFYTRSGQIAVSYATATGPSSADARTEGYLIHECTHAVHHQLAPTRFWGPAFPQWFTEGLARYLQIRLNRTMTAPTFATRVMLSPLDADPYNNGEQAVRHLFERGGGRTLAGLITTVEGGTPFPAALQRVAGTTLPDLEAALRR